jgi:hypothetical protein
MKKIGPGKRRNHGTDGCRSDYRVPTKEPKCDTSMSQLPNDLQAFHGSIFFLFNLSYIIIHYMKVYC